MNYEEYESYNDMYDDNYEDEAIIEAALDIYNEYDVSMEEAVDIAMEKVYRDPGAHKIHEMEKARGQNFVSYYDPEYADFERALRQHANFKTALNSKGLTDSTYKYFTDRYGDFGYTKGAKPNALKNVRVGDRSIHLRKRGGETNAASTNTEESVKRRKPVTLGHALGGAAVAAGVTGAGIAISKYRKKKLAEAAKAQREAEELDSKAALKREKAENAVAQAKEASIYFDYD